MSVINIQEITNDPAINIALDTIKIKKQALIFVNSKRSAESLAEKIAKKLKENKLLIQSEKILNILSRPTKQCERLSKCVIKGVAFHHAGLNSKQREIIEDEFRSGNISIICSTPTLAYGLDMPAYRAVIKDLKRYGGRWGMTPIPVLEYLQMAGRAGRPGMEDKGEAICIAQNDDEETAIKNTYLDGEPEEIYSKLAAEPILRTTILSLISTGFANSRKELHKFFSKTFYAHQYEDIEAIEKLIDKILAKLREWEFLKDYNQKEESDFKPANNLNAEENLEASLLGKRVSELYLDPYTANQIMEGLRKATAKPIKELSFIQLASSTLELRPLFKCRTKDYDLVQEKLNEMQEILITQEPSLYDDDYDEFLDTIKTTIILEEWINEADEHDLQEKYDVRPGEFKVKLERGDWILYCAEEFARMLSFTNILKDIKKTRYRLEKGVKEELIPLLKLKNIGRIRARKLFNNGVKDIADVKKTDIFTLVQLIGKAISIDIKKQVGENVENIQVKENKRKGQISLNDYY